jgi:hypothetical protein
LTAPSGTEFVLVENAVTRPTFLPVTSVEIDVAKPTDALVPPLAKDGISDRTPHREEDEPGTGSPEGDEQRPDAGAVREEPGGVAEDKPVEREHRDTPRVAD